MSEKKYNPNLDREGKVREALSLKKYGKKSNEFCDAIDDKGRLFEIKVSTKKGGAESVTTMNSNHLIKWKKVNWVFGIAPPDKNEIWNIYYIPPQRMIPWIKKSEVMFQERKELLDEIEALLKKNKTPHRKMKIFNDIKRRGMTEKGPRVPLAFIYNNGIMVSNFEELMREVDAHYTENLNEEDNENVELPVEWENWDT